MQPIYQLTDTVFYVGVNDRQKVLFENMWPLPHHVSYNSYLIKDQKNVLIDTVDSSFADQFLSKIESHLQGQPLDYLVINHIEPDHSGSIKWVKQRYPNLIIIGNNRTLEMLSGFYGITEGVMEVKDGDTLSIGSDTLTFYMTPMVHWPETMVSYLSGCQVLFSGDAFGSFGALNGHITDELISDHLWPSEMRRYYSNIVGKFGSPVQQALKKLSYLPLKMICSTHGPVWKNQIGRVIDLYDKMSRYQGEDGVVIVYGSMYGHTERMAEEIAAQLAMIGVRHIVMHNVSYTHPSFILADIFRYKGLILGAPTYNNGVYAPMADLMEKIASRQIKNRVFGCFGSFSWAGAAMKKMTAFAQEMKWEIPSLGVENKHAPSEDEFSACRQLAQEIAKSVMER